MMESLFEHAGGEDGLRKFLGVFYAKLLADPLLRRLFGAGEPHHAEHLTAFTAESFGGPDRFTREMVDTTDDELHPLREVPKWTW